MHGPANQPSRSQIQVTLDGKPVEVPRDNCPSLAAIRAQLENIALQNRRVLFGMTVDGAVMNLAESLEAVGPFREVAAVTIGYTHLGQHVLWLAMQQIEKLRVRAESIALLAMINDIKTVQRMWWELLPEVKVPLVTMDYLPEILETSPAGLSIKNVEIFAQQLQELREILVDLDAACAHEEILEFSEALDKRLVPWLAAVGHFLKCLYQAYDA